MQKLHMDEAFRAAVTSLATLAIDSPLDRAILIDDIFGSLRVIFWANADADLIAAIAATLGSSAGDFFSGEIWNASTAPEADREVYEALWEEAKSVPGTQKLRISQRHRSREAWFQALASPPWSAQDAAPQEPPIICFYSFKGGVGRSTALASFAVQRAREGERVAVVDFDLDAPGVGTLLAADEMGTTARWGTVDYWLESGQTQIDISDYYHACRRAGVTGRGEVLVIPAGTLDDLYLTKLSKIDMAPVASESNGAAVSIIRMLDELRKSLDPDWILLDARTGLSEPAGLLLSGLCHLHVIFATGSEQGWLGTRLILDRLGATQVRASKPQLECLLVHTMVPADTSVSKLARQRFEERARDEFTDHYYAAGEGDDADHFWTVEDLDVADAPHVPVHITYRPELASFQAIDDVADILAQSPEHRILTERICARFIRAESNGGDA